MNEYIFLVQVIILMGAVLGALALGEQALVALVCLTAVLANLCVLKQITLCGFHVTASDAYMVAGILSLNVIQEYFGRLAARKAILISFCSVIVYVVITHIHLLFEPSIHDVSQAHFVALLRPMPRIMVASMVVYGLVSYIDYYLYGLFKKICAGRFIVLRNIFSLLVTQWIDTVLFSFLGLYGLVASLSNIIFLSFTVKVMVILLSTPFIGLCRMFFKRSLDENTSC